MVTEDPHEKGLRKILNYGHTIGHAVETWSLINDAKPLTHGEAIAIGMICEALLSSKNNTLTGDDLQDITSYISQLYPAYTIKTESFAQLMEFMQSDKKNENGQIMFSLLGSIGKCDYNCRVSEKDILESFAYFNHIQR
ncbi:3-dehydroquinate synthase [compost metagenome]